MRKRSLSAMVAAIAACAFSCPLTAQETDPARVSDCLLDDPGRFRELLHIARAKKTDGQRLNPLTIEEAQSACDLTEAAQDFPEEIVLPMPCGRRMLFRRVLTPGGSPLAHHLGHFGDIKAENAGDSYLLSASPWEAPISGPFELVGGQRAFYIAKYEVSVIQWAIFTQGLLTVPMADTVHGSDACNALDAAIVENSGGKPPRPATVKPAGSIDWFEAVEFGRAFSEWLVAYDAVRISQGSAPLVPWRGGSTGYVRLPTEPEWEFAARGGEAGRQARAKRFPDMIDIQTGDRRSVENVSEIAFVESSNAVDLVGAIGARAPNALGIYDIVGNVEEITFELFRVVRPDGLHGQAGGYVARGGSSLTPPSALSVSSRREIPLISSIGEGGARITGVRYVLSAPVFSAARPKDGSWQGQDLDRGFTAAALADRQTMAEAGGTSTQRAILIQEIAQLRLDSEGLESQDLETKLAELQALLERSNTQIEQFRANAMRDRAVSAVAIAWAVRQTGQRLYVARRTLQRALDSMKDAGKTPAERRATETKVMKSINRINYELNTQFKLYVAGVQDLAELDPKYLDLILSDAGTVLDSRGADAFGPALDWVGRHARAAQTNGGDIPRDMEMTWLFEVDEFRQRRIDTFGQLQ